MSRFYGLKSFDEKNAFWEATFKIAKDGLTVKFKWPHHHFHRGVVRKVPIAPNWPGSDDGDLTRRCFLARYQALDYGMQVYRRYYRMSQAYWANYFAGPLGRIRKLRMRVIAYFKKRRIKHGRQ